MNPVQFRIRQAEATLTVTGARQVAGILAVSHATGKPAPPQVAAALQFHHQATAV